MGGFEQLHLVHQIVLHRLTTLVYSGCVLLFPDLCVSGRLERGYQATDLLLQRDVGEEHAPWLEDVDKLLGQEVPHGRLDICCSEPIPVYAVSPAYDVHEPDLEIYLFVPDLHTSQASQLCL